MRGSTLSFWSRFYVGRSHPGWLPVLSLISQKFRISISLLGQLADKDSSFPEDRAAPRGRVEIVSVCERLTQWNVRARVCVCVTFKLFGSRCTCMSAGLSESFLLMCLFLASLVHFCLLPHWLTVSCSNSFHWCQVFLTKHLRKRNTRGPFLAPAGLQAGVSSGVSHWLVVPSSVHASQLASECLQRDLR